MENNDNNNDKPAAIIDAEIAQNGASDMESKESVTEETETTTTSTSDIIIAKEATETVPVISVAEVITAPDASDNDGEVIQETDKTLPDIVSEKSSEFETGESVTSDDTEKTNLVRPDIDKLKKTYEHLLASITQLDKNIRIIRQNNKKTSLDAIFNIADNLERALLSLGSDGITSASLWESLEIISDSINDTKR